MNSPSDQEKGSKTLSEDNFGTAADIYWAAGWRGILPVLPSTKRPVVSGHHGKSAPNVTSEELNLWKNIYLGYGVALRLWEADELGEYEVIGLDVDHYDDKKGYDTLTALEDSLGKLPQTWISTARSDIRSGIRFFCVPAGLELHDIGGHIDTIARGIRYAVVWPTVHPGVGSSYQWYNPDGQAVNPGVVPSPYEFPVLPEAWVDYLSQGRKEFKEVKSDNISTDYELVQWAADVMHGWEDEPCFRMQEKLEIHEKKLVDEQLHHESIVNALMNLSYLSQEGHCGGLTAMDYFTNFWIEDALKNDKRDFPEARREASNAYLGALRKVKGRVDSDGSIDEACRCATRSNVLNINLNSVGGSGSGGPPTEFDDIPSGGMKPVNEYDTNDDGNAQHFIDFWSSGGKASVRWVEGYGWIIWNAGDNPHWERDETGEGKIRRMWRKIAQRQAAYADACFADYQNKANAFAQNPLGTITGADVAAAKAVFGKWQNHALNSGKNKNAKDAIQAAKSMRGISIDINKLDANRRLMGVANGVLELTADGARLRQAQPEDYIMFNTGIEYSVPSGIGLQLWEEYLDTFLPDPALRETAQIALGHCVLGGNPEKRVIVLKGVTNTGKSTMVAMIEKALGDYAGSTSQQLFKNAQFNTDFLTVANKRAVILSEFEEEDKLSASVIKRLSGNSDKMTTAIKNSNAVFSAIPQFVPILPTNAVPTITGADRALQDRLFVIPFNVKPTEIKRSATDVLIAMAGNAAFWWMIEGFNKYCALGELPVSEEVRQETADFVSNLDEIATFASECIRQHSQIDDSSVEWKKYPAWCVTRSKMYDEFRKWWDINNLNMSKIPSAIKLTNRLRELGLPGTPGKQVVRVGTESTRWWFGVKVTQGGGTVSRLPGFKVIQSQSDTESDTGEN